MSHRWEGADRDDGLLIGELHRVRPGRIDGSLLGDWRTGHDEQEAVVEDDFLGVLGALARADDLAACGVQDRYRCANPQRRVDAVAFGDQQSRKLNRPGTEPLEVVGPSRNGPLPEQHAVEGVAGGEKPLGGDLRRGRRALVDDLKDASFGGDQRAGAGQDMVISAPHRLGQPLHVPRRSNARIVRHGVARRVVQEVGPLVDLFRPRLDGLRPLAVALDVRHAAGRQHAHHLVDGNCIGVFGHKEIDEVVDVGETLAAQPIQRDLAVNAQRVQMLSGFLDIARVGVQTMYKVTVIHPQGRSQSSIPTAEMNDQTALNACLIQDLLWRLGVSRSASYRHDQHHHRCCRQPKQDQSGSRIHRQSSLLQSVSSPSAPCKSDYPRLRSCTPTVQSTSMILRRPDRKRPHCGGGSPAGCQPGRSNGIVMLNALVINWEQT